jgi:hypothetical protein
MTRSDISGLDLVWAAQLFYTYFYNHAHRLRLEKLLYLELYTVEVLTGFKNCFWVQMAVSLLKPPNGEKPA